MRSLGERRDGRERGGVMPGRGGGGGGGAAIVGVPWSFAFVAFDGRGRMK